MKVLHLWKDIAGNSWGLSRGERALGLQSDLLIHAGSSFNYPADINLRLDRFDGYKIQYFLRFFEFLKFRKKYDVFHFNGGASFLHRTDFSFLNQSELPFYPKHAKLFVTYNGCDARQKYPTMARTQTAACHNANCYGGLCNSGKVDEERRRGIAKMTRFVQHMWALNPDLLYFLPKEKASFLPYTVADFAPQSHPPKMKKKMIVAHAPTNQEVKGSKYVLEALHQLQQKYPDHIEMLLVEGKPNQTALEMYRQADLVIDQLLIGWYGAFAVEAMLMGKPVIARIALSDLHFIPAEMAKDLNETIINANPTTLYAVLEECLQNRTLLQEKGKASLAYATNWHHPEYVASLTKTQYEKL